MARYSNDFEGQLASGAVLAVIALAIAGMVIAWRIWFTVLRVAIRVQDALAHRIVNAIGGDTDSNLTLAGVTVALYLVGGLLLFLLGLLALHPIALLGMLAASLVAGVGMTLAGAILNPQVSASGGPRWWD